MSFITVGKKIAHPELPKNNLGLTIKDYGGVASTLCGGCGHDSISAAVSQAFFELNWHPHKMMKFSGIGCSSKMPAYFLGSAHGFNSAHGRMPGIATGAHAARRDIVSVGVSGDGDSLSIGLGQFVHAIRRRLDMTYIIANNGVYGLTKGQFSASSDLGAKLKSGKINSFSPIDPTLLGITLGASFVGRAFSGDRHQMVELLKAALQHKGFSLLDIISPCVTFNEHEGSTKSYRYVRKHLHRTNEIIQKGESRTIEYSDGTSLKLKEVDPSYNPTCSHGACHYLQEHHQRGEIVTGLLYIDESQKSMHELMGSVDQPLAEIPVEDLVPTQSQMDEFLQDYC